jgi:hypothetical protein
MLHVNEDLHQEITLKWSRRIKNIVRCALKFSLFHATSLWANKMVLKKKSELS